MQQPRYFSVEELVSLIDSPNREGCQRLLEENRDLFQRGQGSTNNHQAWPGGYIDHIQEIMNIALVLYEELNILRPLPFSLSDVLLVVFLHDVEKPWKYERGSGGELHHSAAFQTKEDQHRFRDQKLLEYGIHVTPEQQNGLRYAEGELSEYSNRRRVMNPLATLCHLADVTSARIWFDHPLQENDPWAGARRNRD